ncbi:MAG: 4Fe-4S dicluster domain-containing protein [Bacteroidales bacterium]
MERRDVVNGPSPVPEEMRLGRRDFLKKCGAAGAAMLTVIKVVGAETGKPGYKPNDHYYGMIVDPARCIGCTRCMEACKAENDVPAEGGYCRTWVERYTTTTDGETLVEALDEQRRTKPPVDEKKILRTYFVPKLCNHCANPPCVQVCPVGATFSTKDGVVLVDKDYCIGCRYCIQACPYGARYLDPRTYTADKCTFCYHRVTKGLAPACVEVCPTGARVFGELRDRNSPLARYLRFDKLQVLKPHLNTEPKVYYVNLDGEVR